MEEISIKNGAKKKIIRCPRNYWKLSTHSLAMITKQQVRINYIEEISIKIHAKKKKKLSYIKTILVSFETILWTSYKNNKLKLIIWKKLASKLMQKR